MSRFLFGVVAVAALSVYLGTKSITLEDAIAKYASFEFESDKSLHCPGSPSFIHASCSSLVRINDISCSKVKEEMVARVRGQETGKWHDSHNNGRYSILNQEAPGSLLLERRTGDDRFTDKILFTFSDDENSCSISGCSESQVTSVADFSTNYCNMWIMYCGVSNGCPYVKYDLADSHEIKVRPSIGAGTSKSACLSAAK